MGTVPEQRGQTPMNETPMNATVYVNAKQRPMKRLTKIESFIMEQFWKNGAMTVNELREHYPDPKPHVNTISTRVRILESDGFLGHEKEGTGFRYHATVTREQYAGNSFGSLVSNCFDNSFISAVSALVDDDKISVDELKELIRQIESRK